MAIDKTPRLNLAKQAAGDQDWDVGLDQGFDDADARALRDDQESGLTNVRHSAVFTGVGLDDITSSGVYSGSALAVKIEVEIDGNGTPDTYKWRKDGVEQAALQPLLATEVLVDGVGYDSATQTLHTIGDIWTFWAFKNIFDPRDWDGQGNSMEGHFAGQQFMSQVLGVPHKWLCTTAGAAGVAVWEPDESLIGMLKGIFSVPSNTTMQLGRGYGGKYVVEVDGLVFGVTASDLVFDMTTDHDTTENADEAAYAYVGVSFGVLTPHISDVVPDADGYHPTKNWRCVGVAWNDNSSNLVSASVEGDLCLFNKIHTISHIHSLLDEDIETNCKLVSLNIPNGTVSVVLDVLSTLVDAYLYIFRSGVTSINDATSRPIPNNFNLASENAALFVGGAIVDVGGPNDATPCNARGEVPIEDGANPGVRYTHVSVVPTSIVNDSYLVVKGFRFPWFPRGRA